MSARARPGAPFIVGTPRSGTTLLRLMLDAHPQLAIPAETHFIPRLVRRWRKLEAGGAAEDQLRRMTLELIVSHRRWADLGIDAEALEAHLHSVTPLRLADAARAAHVVHARTEGKPRWGDKTPGYSRRIRLISRVLEEARFVHVIRDGRDVAVSLAGVSWGPDEVGEAARLWQERILDARGQAGELEPGRYMEIRYEELVADPGPQLRPVARFLDLPWDDAMLRYHEGAAERMAPLARDFETTTGALRPAAERAAQHALVTEPPRPDRIGRWRTEMEPAKVRAFEAVAGELLEELAYELAGTQGRL